MAQILYSPKQVSQQLKIASSTLRLWAVKFGPALSDHANPSRTETGRPGRRSFTNQDLRILAYAKELLRDGLGFDRALAVLQTEPLPEPEPAPSQETALAIPEFLDGMANLAHLAIDQRERLDELERRLAELEKSRPPWWRRLFGR